MSPRCLPAGSCFRSIRFSPEGWSFWPLSVSRISRSSTTHLRRCVGVPSGAELVRRKPTLEPPTSSPCGPVTPSVIPSGANRSTPPSGSAGIACSFSHRRQVVRPRVRAEGRRTVAFAFFLRRARRRGRRRASPRRSPRTATATEVPLAKSRTRRFTGGSMSSRQDLDVRARASEDRGRSSGSGWSASSACSWSGCWRRGSRSPGVDLARSIGARASSARSSSPTAAATSRS